MSVQQLEALLDYLEGHQQLALGRCSRSKEGRSLSKRLWQKCATILNSVASDCIQKTGDQWRMFYNEYKHRLLKKIKQVKAERSATGGGSAAAGVILTPIQKRLCAILERDVGETSKKSQQTAPSTRLHRQRRQKITPEPEEQSSCRQCATATKMIQNIEMANANATIRLAAAIETLAARLNEPIRVVLEDAVPSQGVQERVTRIIDSSDSDPSF